MAPISTTEQDARIVINRKLQESGWILEGANRNVLTEQQSDAGFADYLLLGRKGENLALIEAKRDDIDPYTAKEQARGYAEAKGCRYVFLANSEQLYFWDMQEGDAVPIEQFISPDDLQRRTDLKQLRRPLTQIPHNAEISERAFAIEASNIITKQFDEQGKRAFLLEMATGTGKTRLAAALMDRFLKARQVERVLFIVDRIELRKQAIQEFQTVFKDLYGIASYVPGKHGKWGGATIVVATIQSLNANYKNDFTPGYFDLVFNDECHRSIYGELPRQVLSYFQAIRIGLTATPRDFLKSIEAEKLSETNPKALEARMMRDTYTYFGCEPGIPTFRYSIQDGVKDGYLVPPKIHRMVSLVTKSAVADEGWSVEIDGEDYTFAISQLEKRVLIPQRNRLLCQQFLQNALRAPDGAIGKTIVFAVSQNHAVQIARILNELVPEANDKFAQVITSNVQDASELAKAFRKPENYWPRVAVSVDMLSTGYDCREILNIVLARPIASPTSYIQIKGRGTRTYEFPDGTKKTHFLVHDFCEVAAYFDEKYDFTAPLPTPAVSSGKDKPDHTVCGPMTTTEGPAIPPEFPSKETPESGPPPIVEPPIKGPITYTGMDAKLFSEFIEVGPEGEKVDRMLYRDKWETLIKDAAQKMPELAQAGESGEFSEEVMEYLNTQILNKPEEYFNEHNLAKVYRVFSSIQEYVRAALGKTKLPTPQEQLHDLIQSLIVEHELNQEQTRLLRVLVQQISQSPQYARAFIDGSYDFLNNPPFTSYGGVDAYVRLMGDKVNHVFRDIRESNALKLTVS